MSSRPFPALVNKVPPGFLRLLGLQNFGRNPNQLAEYYQPVIELRDWLFYTQTNWLNDSFDAGIAANGQYDPLGTGLTVPAGEVWYVLDAGFDIAMDPGSTCTASAYILVPNPGTGNTPIFASEPRVIPQNDHVHIPLRVQPGMFLPTGSRPQARLSNITGTGTGRFALTVARLPG